MARNAVKVGALEIVGNQGSNCAMDLFAVNIRSRSWDFRGGWRGLNRGNAVGARLGVGGRLHRIRVSPPPSQSTLWGGTISVDLVRTRFAALLPQHVAALALIFMRGGQGSDFL